MSDTPGRKQKRRTTIFVTGPQSKKIVFEGEEEPKSVEKKPTLQDLAIARQRMQNELALVNTTSGIEILVQIFMDEMEIVRHRLRENGQRMRHFFSDSALKIHQILLRIFSKSVSSRNMIEYKNEEKLILNECSEVKNGYKMPRFTLNDIEEVLMTDDLEDGVIQKRSEKWTFLPERPRNFMVEEDFSEFRKLNVPMEMFDEEEEDRYSMPSTRTQLTTEDQMAVIQNQLAMLSKQLMSLQKGDGRRGNGSSRASSRRGARKMEKKSSIEITSTSSSEISEDEGKGPSVCSPSHSSIRKSSGSSSSKLSSVAPMAQAPPPPPPPPPALGAPKIRPLSEKKSENVQKSNEVVVASRPYLTDIANGRSMLKKTVRSPGGSPACQIRHQKRAVSSFEAALRDRFRGFHGDTSYSEQEENGEDDEDVNGTWDE